MRDFLPLRRRLRSDPDRLEQFRAGDRRKPARREFFHQGQFMSRVPICQERRALNPRATGTRLPGAWLELLGDSYAKTVAAPGAIDFEESDGGVTEGAEMEGDSVPTQHCWQSKAISGCPAMSDLITAPPGSARVLLNRPFRWSLS